MPFYFAWTGANQPFDGSVIREDEAVFAFDLAHLEGQIPTLSIDIKNPHIGLLAPGRAQWVWLSWRRTPTDNPVPLFYGRLVAMPTNLLGETVTLSFLARPDDFLARKQTIANGLMIEPWYDPIWIDQSKLTDPDTVLETYAMTWHVDRITHGVSISDILFGEDGTEEFLLEESFYDNVSISFAQSPQTQVVFSGTVQWTQAATGLIRMPDVSLEAWNGQQIINDWPKPGSNLQGGWAVEDSAITNWSDTTANNNPTVIDVGGGTSPNTSITTPGSTTTLTPGAGITVASDIGHLMGGIRTQIPDKGPGGAHTVSINWQNQEKEHFPGDTLSISESATYDAFGKMGVGAITSQSTSGKQGESASISFSWVFTYGLLQVAPSTAPSAPITVRPDGTVNPNSGQQITVPSLFGQLMLRYNLSLPHTEVLTFVMNSDIQPIVLLPPDDPINQIQLTMNGADLGLPIDPGGVAPIGDPSRSSFFLTDRGQLAMQYPMLVARAHLAQAARAAKITFDCTFERALDLSCRKNALLHDLRLPGGQVTGKITEYHLVADGDRGELIGKVQIEAVIGEGASLIVNEGTPTYVVEGYVTPGFQFYSGQEILLPTGDANIVMPAISMSPPPDDFVLPLTFDEAVVAFQVHQGTPVDLVVSGAVTTADPTWLEIVLQPVTGQKFETDYNLGNSTVVFPKLIDLAAASSG